MNIAGQNYDVEVQFLRRLEGLELEMEIGKDKQFHVRLAVSDGPYSIA